MPSEIAVILADGRSKPKHIDNPYSMRFRGRTLLVRTIQQFAEKMPVVVATTRPDVGKLIEGQRNVGIFTPPFQYEELGGVAMIPKALDLVIVSSVSVRGQVGMRST